MPFGSVCNACAVKETPMKRTVLILVTLAVAGIVASVGAQQAGFKRTVLQQGDLSMPGREVVTAIAEFQPGATVGRHTQPGEEAGYVLEGSIVLEQAGKPTVTLAACSSTIEPSRT